MQRRGTLLKFLLMFFSVALNVLTKQAQKLREKRRRKFREKTSPRTAPSKMEALPKTSLCRNPLLRLEACVTSCPITAEMRRGYFCITFGGFCWGLSWRIFLGTFPHKNEKKKKSGDKIRKTKKKSGSSKTLSVATPAEPCGQKKQTANFGRRKTFRKVPVKYF